MCSCRGNYNIAVHMKATSCWVSSRGGRPAHKTLYTNWDVCVWRPQISRQIDGGWSEYGPRFVDAAAEGPSRIKEYLNRIFFLFFNDIEVVISSFVLKHTPHFLRSAASLSKVWRMCFATNVWMAQTFMKARTWTRKCLADSGWGQRDVGGLQRTYLLIKRIFEFWSLEDQRT